MSYLKSLLIFLSNKKGFAGLRTCPVRRLKRFLLCSAVVVGIFLMLILKERFCVQAGPGFLPGNLGPEYFGRIFPPALRPRCLFLSADHGAG